jgi:hypothetical protein
MSQRTHARLETRRRQRGEPKSRLAERLIDEGLEMEEYPGLVFRDGPAGRRPALAAGPDVWEVVETLLETGQKGESAVIATAKRGKLDPGQVRTAVAYYADHRDEIDAWIAANREQAARERAAWERAQAAIG